MRWRICWGVALVLLAGRVPAQESGRWWWEGSIGAGQRQSDRSGGAVVGSESNQEELRLSLAMNGFIVHPTIGNFRLGVDLLASELDGSRRLDSDRYGFSAELGLLPRGAYPLKLFLRRQVFDQASDSGLEDGDAGLLLGRVPDASLRAGGRLRIRRGPLAGSLIGFERTTFDFDRADVDDEFQERQFWDWSRPGERLRQHVRVEHSAREYGLVGLDVDDLTANVDESGVFGDDWNWRSSSVAIRRKVSTASSETRIDDLRVRNRLYRSLRGSDQLDFSLNLGFVEPDVGRLDGRLDGPLDSTEAGPDETSFESIGATFFYRWRPRPSIELAPFVQYLEQTNGAVSVRSPRAGLSVGLHRERPEGVDLLVSVRSSYGEIDRNEESSSRESQAAFAASATIGHGQATGVRKEFEFEVGRNELRLFRDPLLELPDLGASARSRDEEDFARARISLGHRWDSRSVRVWGEWSRRGSSGQRTLASADAETLSANLQHDGPRYDLQFSLGDTRVERGGETQEVQYRGFSARWQLRASLSVQASYREDRREFLLTPGVSGERAQVSLRYRIGQIRLEGAAFRAREAVAGALGRDNEGFSWSISRQLGGWLPIATGSSRRGVIR